MDFIVGFLFLISACMFIVFMVFQPNHNDKRSISIYNTTVIGLDLFLTGMFFLYMRVTYKGGIDDGWWLFMGLCGSFIIFSLILIIGFITRNLYLFRGTSQNFYKKRR